MPKGSFYHLFESKEDFVIKAIAHFEEMVGKNFRKKSRLIFLFLKSSDFPQPQRPGHFH